MANDHKEEEYSPQPEAQKKPEKKWIPDSWLKDWGLTYTWKSTIVLYLVVGVVSFAYGLLISSMNSTVVEVEREYGSFCGQDPICNVPITIPRDMKKPVFLYYGLKNFYQNHRLYLMSKSNSQLAGHEIDEHHAEKECGAGAYKNKDLGYNFSVNGRDLSNDTIAVPCGLIPKTMFTDRYQLWTADAKNITLNDQDLVWPKVAGKVYKNRLKDKDDKDVNWKDIQWTDVEEEHFMVWMKTGVFADGRRLWARIEQDLPAGDYFMKVSNTYRAEDYHSQKFFVLATANIFGGKVEFLAATFMVIGMIFVLISLCFFNRSKETRRVNFIVRGVTN